jgi:hypothetical protein
MLTLVKVFDCCDQLPFGPHSDAVRAERVDDFESQRSGQFEVLHCEADGGGALTDHADVRGCSEQFKEATARILREAKGQRQRIVPQLRNKCQYFETAKANDEISPKQSSLPASGRARWGANRADSH